MTLYLRTTTDKLELPVAVAESPTELGRMLGLAPGSVSTSISKHHKGWFKLEVEDEMDEWYADNDGGLWRYREDGTVERRD